MDPSTRQGLFDNYDPEVYMTKKKELIQGHKSYVSDWMYELFSKGKKTFTVAHGDSEGHITGETILDIGTGPDINTALYTYPYFNKMYLSDYSRNNRKYLEEWLHGQHNDEVRSYVEGAIKREGSTQTPNEKQNELRSKIAGILYCDVTQKNPIGTDSKYSNEQFDAVITAWCLNSAVNSEEEYMKAIQNMISLIKPGGYLVFMDVCTDKGTYAVGDTEYPCFVADDERVQAFFEKSFKTVSPFVKKNFDGNEGKAIHCFNIAVQIPK